MPSQQFHYDTGSEKLGPVSGAELLCLLAAGEITPETWVRRADSSTWRQLSNIDLSKEKEEEQKRSVRRALWQSLSPATIVGIICLILFLIALLWLGIMAVKFLWPLILVLIIAAWIMRVMR